MAPQHSFEVQQNCYGTLASSRLYTEQSVSSVEWGYLSMKEADLYSAYCQYLDH